MIHVVDTLQPIIHKVRNGFSINFFFFFSSNFIYKSTTLLNIGSSEAMNALIQASSKLKSLVLRSINANITKQEILRISETCKDLEEVSFCFFTREMSDPEFWSVFVSGLPKLQRAVVKCYHQPVALDVLAPYYQRCITDSILNSNEQANYYRQPSSAFVMDTSCLPHMKTEYEC